MPRIRELRRPVNGTHYVVRTDFNRTQVRRYFVTMEEAERYLYSLPGYYASPQDRVQRNTRQDESGCWIWTAQISTSTGYGRFRLKNRETLAHRFSYEAFVGPIPQGLQIDHLCRVRACVNPQHLEPVTGAENRRRSPINFVGINAAKTHCVNGHPFDAENTRTTYKGGRECKTCRREVTRRYRARQAAAQGGAA